MKKKLVLLLAFLMIGCAVRYETYDGSVLNKHKSGKASYVELKSTKMNRSLMIRVKQYAYNEIVVGSIVTFKLTKAQLKKCIRGYL